MNNDILEELGLTKNELIVYKTLLSIGPSLAGEITKKTKLHRRSIYDLLEMLIKKGLVGYIVKNNRKLFEASNPNKFIDILKEREQRVQEILPKMLESYEMTKEKQETNFYKGKDGLRTVFEDQIDTGKEILILGGSPLAYDLLKFYFRWFDRQRKEKKIKIRGIFQKTDKKLRIPISEIKYLPEKYSSPLAVNIYGDKVAIILWSKENPFAVVIKGKDISDGYRKYFDLMWKLARKE